MIHLVKMTRGIWLHRKKWVVRGFVMKALMTIHKRFSDRWSTQLGSSALESRCCHFPSPQKGAAIDGVGCEREITQNSAPGLSQVTCRRTGVGVEVGREDRQKGLGGGSNAHLAHYRCHRGTKNSKSGGCECTGLTAADTFSHKSEFVAFCSSSLPGSRSYYGADRAPSVEAAAGIYDFAVNCGQ